MDETNFDWDDLRLFLAVARYGGLAAAAQATGKSPPTLGRRMLTLERAVGADLFHRLPRGYTLTPQGETLLAQVAGVEGQIVPLVRPRDRVVPVKISAGTWMTTLICRHAEALMVHGAAIRFIAADHVMDISHREAVIGIRNQRPTQAGLACRKVGRVRFAGYAVDSAARPWAQTVGSTPSALWVAAQGGPAPIEVTSPRNALDLTVAGITRAVLPTFIGDAEPGLTRVSEPIPDLDHDQWLVTHHEDRFVPAVRQVIDRLHRLLRSIHRGQPPSP